MDPGDKFFVEILSALERERVLKHFILIGGWCQRLYRHHFNYPTGISALRTADIDFLVRNPEKIHTKVDIAKILKTLGFDELFHPQGYIKYVHPDLEIEFLVPEVGKKQEKPFPLTNLNTNAQRLRHLDIIEKYPVEISFHELNVLVPQPAAFVINKFIISQRRKDASKKEKDLLAAKELGDYILKNEDQKQLLIAIFNNLNKKLQKKLLEIIKNQSLKIYDLLVNRL